MNVASENLKTNPKLELAYNFIQYTGQNIFLTGKAGTGKTTFLKSLKERSPKRMIVVAPTGVAAINAGGVTIHSFFQLSFAPQVGVESQMSADQRFTKEKINIMRTLDLLVIDEISMVRADILDAIDRTLRRFKNRKKPFGGVQLLMIGDLQQLAPVVKNEEWELMKDFYETPYFFSSRVLQEFPYVSIELTEVFRQQDDHFIRLLNKVRDNLVDEWAMNELNKRVIPGFAPDDDEGYITLCTHNASARRINENKLRQLPGRKEKFTASVQGKFPEYSYPADFELELKKGAQVMFVKNDTSPEKRFFNGKIGQVTGFGDETVLVKCPGDDHEIEVEAQTWENMKYSIDKESGEIKEELEGSFTQIPLKTAWAITIHKSQGLTFEKAIIDAEASFAHGQVYVALSRCKTLEGMVLSTPVTPRSIITDGKVSGFIRQVEENQPGEKELYDARLAFQKEQLTELFRFNRLSYLVNQVNKLIGENKGSFTEITADIFASMETSLKTDVEEVAEKFLTQVERYLNREPDVGQNGDLQERIKKAAIYFSDKLTSLVTEVIDGLDLDIDNRALKTKLKNIISGLYEETATKLAGYEQCRDGFNIRKMMDARAKAMLESGGIKSGKQKARETVDFKNIPHPELYHRLRQYRFEKSEELDVPAYMVFSQKALVELVNFLPSGLKTLRLINGLGPRKVALYGEEIIEIIRVFLEENQLVSGELQLQKEREKKPRVDTKKVSFEMFQNGKTVAEIAKERSLSTGTIEGHLAHFVKLGKLEVTRLIEKEKLEIITAYFEKTDDKSLGKAKEHFGERFSYSELRIALSYLEREKE